VNREAEVSQLMLAGRANRSRACSVKLGGGRQQETTCRRCALLAALGR